MSTSVNYYYLTSPSFPGNHIRAEIIQVDNGPNHVNISVNLHTDSTLINRSRSNFSGKPWSISGYTGDRSTRLFSYDGTLSQLVSSTGDWTLLVEKWCATVSRSGSFVIVASVMYGDDDTQSTWYFSVNQSIQFKPYVPDDVQDNVTSSLTATLGTAKTFTISNGGSYAQHTDTLQWSFDGTNWTTISSSISVSSGGTGSVSYTFPASTGSNFPSEYTGTCTLRLITKSGSTTIGTRNYSLTLSVPSYSYSAPGTPTVSKQTYSGVGGSNYVATKHKVRFAVPAPPSGQYGATIKGVLKLYYTGSSTTLHTEDNITSSKNVDFVPPSAGTLVASYTIIDSRGVNNQNVSRTINCIANPVTRLNFTAERSGATTTVNLSASGTYDNTISGNTAQLKLFEGSSTSAFSTTNGSNGSASKTTTRTLGLTSAQSYKATMTDALGNTATKTITVPLAFAFMQIGTCAGKGVAVGRYGTMGGSEDKMEVGMPLEIGDPAGQYMVRVGPRTINNTTTWEFSVLQNGTRVLGINPIEGFVMYASNGTTKTLELSNNLLSIKTTSGVERVNMNPTDGLTFKDSSGSITNNYPAVTPLSPYWRIKNQPWNVRSSPNGTSIATITTNGAEYPFLGDDGTWINIYYSAAYPSAYIVKTSQGVVSGELIYK